MVHLKDGIYHRNRSIFGPPTNDMHHLAQTLDTAVLHHYDNNQETAVPIFHLSVYYHLYYVYNSTYPSTL